MAARTSGGSSVDVLTMRSRMLGKKSANMAQSIQHVFQDAAKPRGHSQDTAFASLLAVGHSWPRRAARPRRQSQSAPRHAVRAEGPRPARRARPRPVADAGPDHGRARHRRGLGRRRPRRRRRAGSRSGWPAASAPTASSTPRTSSRRCSRPPAGAWRREGLQQRPDRCSGPPTIRGCRRAARRGPRSSTPTTNSTNPVTLLRNTAESLKPHGRVGIVDFKRDGSGPGPALEERVDPDVIVRDAEAAGLRLAAARDVPALPVPPDLRPAVAESGAAAVRLGAGSGRPAGNYRPRIFHTPGRTAPATKSFTTSTSDERVAGPPAAPTGTRPARRRPARAAIVSHERPLAKMTARPAAIAATDVR